MKSQNFICVTGARDSERCISGGLYCSHNTKRLLFKCVTGARVSERCISKVLYCSQNMKRQNSICVTGAMDSEHGIPHFRQNRKKDTGILGFLRISVFCKCDGRKGFRAMHLQSAVLFAKRRRAVRNLCDGGKGFRAAHSQSALLLSILARKQKTWS